MAEPTFLQLARQQLAPFHGNAPIDARVAIAHISLALDRVLQHLEQEAAMRGPALLPSFGMGEPQMLDAPAQVPSEPKCPTCGDAFTPAHGRECDERRELSKKVGELDLDALQKLCDAATPGPWYCAEGGDTLLGEDQRLLEGFGYRGNNTEANIAFIAAARDALPKLIARVRQLQAERRNSTEATLHDVLVNAFCGGATVVRAQPTNPWRGGEHAR